MERGLSRYLPLFLVVAAGGVGLRVATPDPALACSPGPTSVHCYATLDWDHGPGFKGEDGYIITDCMNMADETTEFITNEMWLLLYPFSGQNQTNKTFWVEAGITRGPPDPGHFTGPPGTQRRFYWAEDQYPSNKYTEHYPPSTDPRPVLGTPYYFKIRYAGTGAWNVFAGPTFSGTSTNTFDWGSDSLSTGSEIAASTSGAQTGSYSGGLGFFAPTATTLLAGIRAASQTRSLPLAAQEEWPPCMPNGSISRSLFTTESERHVEVGTTDPPRNRARWMRCYCDCAWRPIVGPGARSYGDPASSATARNRCDRGGKWGPFAD